VELVRVSEEAVPDMSILAVVVVPGPPPAQTSVHVREGGSAAPTVWLQLLAPPCPAKRTATQTHVNTLSPCSVHSEIIPSMGRMIQG
jgi:hypothetical protein